MRTLVRMIFMILIAVSMAACHGEPVPPDYQNTPATPSAADSRDEAPQGGTSTSTPEPDSTAEGTSAPYEPTGPAPTAPPE